MDISEIIAGLGRLLDQCSTPVGTDTAYIGETEYAALTAAIAALQQAHLQRGALERIAARDWGGLDACRSIARAALTPAEEAADGK